MGRKATLLVVTVATFSISGALGLIASSALMAAGSSFSPAQDGENSYEIEGIGIEYPFVPNGEGGSDPQQAGLSFTAVWTSATYPGEVQCRITLTNVADEVIGQTLVNVDSLQPRSVGSANLPVPVEEQPERADIQCEAGSYAPGQGYRVSVARSAHAGPGSGAEIDMKADWVGQYPGTRMCEAVLLLRDGSSIRQEFTLDAPDGTVFPVRVPSVNAGEIASMSTTCEAYTG